MPDAGNVDHSATAGVTRRAVLLGFALLLPVAVGAFYVEIAWGRLYEFGSGVPAMAPVVVLFLLALVMGLPGLRRSGMTRREMLVVYSIVLVAGPLVSHGILFWMVPKTISYYYAAQLNPQWEAAFLRYVPGWFAPSEPAAVMGLFEGHARVPWLLWAVPGAAWLSFMLALFLCTLCLLSLLQRQWISNERLAFPLAQLPLEMIRESGERDRGRAGRLTAVGVFWGGIAASFGLNFLNALSIRVPSIPAIPLGGGDDPNRLVLMAWHKVGPLAGLGEISLVLTPWMIAVAYLLPMDLSLSAWFFWLVRLALTVAAIAGGAAPQMPEGWYDSSFPAPYFQGGGASLALALWVLWTARRHLRHALQTAWRTPRSRSDADEPMPHRWAVAGFVLTFGFMLWFYWLAGCRLVFAVVMVSLVVGYYVMWARVRAETGLGFLPFPLEIQSAMVVPFGSGVFRTREIIAMISTRWAFFPGFGESFEVCTGNALETFKVADAAGIAPRRLTPALVAGFVLSLGVGFAIILAGLYHYGFFGLAMGSGYTWPSWQTRNDGQRVFFYLVQPEQADMNGLAAISAGAATALVLGMLRARLWWWPLHPVGYIAANCWGMQFYAMPFLVGWLCKSLVIRYGGPRQFRKTVPLAIGVIVGDLLNEGIWAVIALVTRGRV